MGSWEISKEFTFSASHILDGLPEGHQCGRLHGHNYVVRVAITSGLLDEVGFVLDYGALAPVKAWIDDTLDHRHLNELMPVAKNPTAELLARWIGEMVRVLVMLPPGAELAIGVSETPKTWAWWSE